MPAVRGTCAKCAVALGVSDHTGSDENKNANSQVLIKRQQPVLQQCCDARRRYCNTAILSFTREASGTSTRVLVPPTPSACSSTAADGVQGADAAANSALVVDDDDEAATGQVAANATAPTATAVYAATGPFVYSYTCTRRPALAWWLGG